MKKNNFKKLLTLVLSLSLLLSVTSISNAEQLNNFDANKLNEMNINIPYNSSLTLNTDKNKKDILNRFKTKFENIESKKTKTSFKLKNLEPVSFEESKSTPFIYDGTMNIEDNSYKLSATGNLLATKCDNGEVVLIGTLGGYLNDTQTDENWCNLAIHYSPNSGACLINATIGVLNDLSTPISLSFGEQTSILKEAVIKLYKNKFEKEKSSESAPEVNTTENASLMSSGSGTPAADDPILKNASSSCNSSIFTSVTFQNKTHPQLNNQVLAKTSVNFDRALTYIKNNVDSTLNSPGVYSDSARLWLISADPSFQCSDDFSPTSGSTSISIPIIPIYLGSMFGWQLQNYTFTVSSTSVTFVPCTGAGSGTKNIGKWSYSSWLGLGGSSQANSYYHSLETTKTSASDAAGESKGIVSKCIYSYYAGASSEKSISVGATGYADITYGTTNGSVKTYTMQCTAAGSMTIVPANNPY